MLGVAVNVLEVAEPWQLEQACALFGKASAGLAATVPNTAAAATTTAMTPVMTAVRFLKPVLS